MDEYPPVVDRRSVEKDTGATEHRIRFLFNMASMTDAEKAAAHSKAHQKWILDTLKESGGECTYEKLVEVGEEHQCDTVGAMLKILKNRKLIHFKQMFLMYPMHKDEIVKLKKVDGGEEDVVHKTSKLSLAPTKKSVQNEAPAPAVFTVGTEVITDKGSRSACKGVVLRVPSEPNGLYEIKHYGWKAGKVGKYSANNMVQATDAEIKARKESEASKKTLEKVTSVSKPKGGSEQVSGAKLEAAKTGVSSMGDKGATGQTYPYEQLKHPGPFPAGIDVTRRETYLSAADCERLFGMTAEALAQMPKWKRNNLKKKVGLF